MRINNFSPRVLKVPELSLVIYLGQIQNPFFPLLTKFKQTADLVHAFIRPSPPAEIYS